MFCTLICCMDGRFIHLINEYIRNNYDYDFVDTITDAGPVKQFNNPEYLTSIEHNIVLISIKKHKSDHIFISGHSDCAGCPVDDDLQKTYILNAVNLVKIRLPECKVTGLFANKDGTIDVLIDHS